jgi:hypothetical protein
MAERWDGGPSLGSGGEDRRRYRGMGRKVLELAGLGWDRERLRIRIPFSQTKQPAEIARGGAGGHGIAQTGRPSDAKKIS